MRRRCFKDIDRSQQTNVRPGRKTGRKIQEIMNVGFSGESVGIERGESVGIEREGPCTHIMIQ